MKKSDSGASGGAPRVPAGVYGNGRAGDVPVPPAIPINRQKPQTPPEKKK